MYYFISQYINDLDTPISNISISIFRLAFSFVLLIQTYYFIVEDFITKNIVDPVILFPFINGLNPVSVKYLFILSYIMLISNIGMFFNRFYRISTLIFTCCFTYFWLLDKGYFNNHYYFMSIICFLLFFLNNKCSFSKVIYVPKINLMALQFMVLLVYFISGINKVNPYWLFDFQPMKHILEIKAEITHNPFYYKEYLPKLFSYLGLLFDLGIGFLLIFKKTRVFGFGLIFIFNLINFQIFKDIGEIGVFPFLMITTLILFVNPKGYLKIFKLQKITTQIKPSSYLKKFIVVFLILQTLLPFRHILFKGYVDYNGIGQRFSWRMKLMYKEADINYFIINKFTKERFAVNVSTMLTDKQYNNLKYFPDLIVPLAKKIKLEAKENFGINNAKIVCVYKLKFMENSEQLLFSPKIDLSKIQTNTLANKWLFDLK